MTTRTGAANFLRSETGGFNHHPLYLVLSHSDPVCQGPHLFQERNHIYFAQNKNEREEDTFCILYGTCGARRKVGVFRSTGCTRCDLLDHAHSDAQSSTRSSEKSFVRPRSLELSLLSSYLYLVYHQLMDWPNNFADSKNRGVRETKKNCLAKWRASMFFITSCRNHIFDRRNSNYDLLERQLWQTCSGNVRVECVTS